MEKFNQLKELVNSLEADATKFFRQGNATAGTRVRKGLQEIKTLSQELRNDITATKNKDK
ncbi:histone H1 [Sphingobacterium hungaricum]|uniref:Histone H1 n=1 Tax=Sphingobacterium hungaricum TaxID=2082723 RepID=A0A928UZA7_9SPHI|nr:histone H1 [Sphingobacterium hungaricum]MBE8714828.1 histone H1 [Sphingobacterium hungaricum]